MQKLEMVTTRQFGLLTVKVLLTTFTTQVAQPMKGEKQRFFSYYYRNDFLLFPLWKCFSPLTINTLFSHYYRINFLLLPPSKCFSPTTIEMFFSYYYRNVFLLLLLKCFSPTTIKMPFSYYYRNAFLLLLSKCFSRISTMEMFFSSYY